MRFDSITQFYKTAPWWLVRVYLACSHWANINWDDNTNSDDMPLEQVEVKVREQANGLFSAEAVSSAMNPASDSWRHDLMIDLDVPAALIESSSRNHHHLVIAGDYRWEDVQELLEVLAKMGIVEKGYVFASIERKATFLRPPWIRKGKEKSGVAAAIAEWLDNDLAGVLKQRDEAGGLPLVGPENKPSRRVADALSWVDFL